MNPAQPKPLTLDKELQAILPSLADAILPLTEWIRDPAKYKPPDAATLPWRVSNSLTTTDLGLMPFFQKLLEADAGDERIRERWESLIGDPLQFSPLANVKTWRAARDLEAEARFGAADSANVVITGGEKNKPAEPMSRTSFYQAAFPLLKASVALTNPSGAPSWQSFANDLLVDKHAAWPVTAAVKSSEFLKQFARDALYAVLGMTNEAVAEPFRFAVLIELGEHRRVGNALSREHAAQVTDALMKKVHKVLAAPKP